MSSHGPPPRIWHAAGLCAIFVSLFGLLGFRLHHLQVEQGERFATMAERQRQRTWTLPATRGAIYDASGAPIAVSQSSWTLTADPLYMDDRLRATVEIARIVPQLDREELRRQFECGKNGRTLARGLGDDQAQAVKALKLTGVFLERESARTWPGGSIAPHVVGFVNADGKGGAGLEHTLDDRLAGIPGHETLQVDALGKPVLTGNDESVPPVPGASIQLTIEVAIQRELEAALAEAADKHHPAGIAGLVVRPSTGEIMAMASWPTFDPRDRSTFASQALGNRAVQMVYEPGSTMKPLVAGATVAEKLARWDERIDCEHGKYTHRFGRGVRTIHDHGSGHGILTVTEGISLSDNILMAKLGLRMGPERLWEWVSSFHFGHKLGICLPGEGAGIMAPKRAWNELGACMSVPMGHEIAVTPLQLAMAHAGIANRGQWMPPLLVKRVWTEAGGAVKDLPTPPIGESHRIFTDNDAAQIEQAMTHTMTEGTGKKADLDGYIAAGKTGTTMKLIDGRYSDTHHVGSFVCWAPAQPGSNVREKILCLISVDEPTANGHYGAEVAAPYVQRVLQFSLEHCGVGKVDKPEKPEPGKKARRP